MRMVKKGRKAGFTLLELLIVLGIMGFLLAAVAPRLVGVFEGAGETVCESNIKALTQFAAAYEITQEKLPDRMVAPAYLIDGAIVNENWWGPTVEDDAVAGKESISVSMRDQLRLTQHHLNKAEVGEIIDRLGITEIVVLNNPDDANVTPAHLWDGTATLADASAFRLVDLQAIYDADPFVAPVLPMIGGGYGGTAWVNNADWAVAGNTIGDPDLAYRLFLGVGLDSSIVEYTIVTAGQCPAFATDPGAGRVWGWYGMVLPRLEATVVRLASPAFATVTAWADENLTASQRVTFDLTYVGERAMFNIVCPEGCLFGARADQWGIESSTAAP